MPKNPEETPVDMAAAVVEAKSETVKFTYGGTEYECPNSSDIMDALEFMLAAEDGHDLQMARALLGPQQWRNFANKHRKADDARKMINAWSEAAGLGK